MFKKYLDRTIKRIVSRTRLPVGKIIPSNQWLDIKLVRYGLDVTITEHRLYLDQRHLSFDMWVFNAGGEWVNIRLSDLLEIGLDYHAGRSYMGGAGWTAYITGKGMSKDGPK